MYMTTSLSEKLKLFAVILIPILVTQVSMYLMNIFDTMMSGRAGAADLAGVAIGSSLWVPIFTGINGILLAITPIIAQLMGAKSEEQITKKVKQALYLSIALAVLVFVFGALLLNPVLHMMDLESDVEHTAKFYLVGLSTGIVPLFIFNTLRSFIDALGQTRISMFIILLSLPLNVTFNYMFIFGKFGLPAYGGIGAGIATSITYWLVCLIALIVIYRLHPFRNFSVLSYWIRPSFQEWWEQLKIGIPIGAAMFFETSIFSAVTLLMSVYSTYTIAAHQAAMNFASLLYMIPLSVGMALTIAIGFEVGAKRYDHARAYGYIGISGGIFIALFAGLVIYFTRDWVALLYNSNPKVIDLTKQFLIYACFFQLADAFGAPIQGALRGYKDVHVTLMMALISYWVIGLPVGWLLANFTALEPFGYWVGIITGLSCGAIALLARLLYLQRKYKHSQLTKTR
ncbi:putative multidrug resistance protein NorM [Virgibacillus pantothenticus]|uniref:MATE family efflux transporter n=1 Tax=Virgibacillus TaxID=84406 RepID=UPI0009097A1C|nr:MULTISPECIES: MATE family efflux transporter [Virgibacillus]API91131.1 MATE family efflux transporter [Virgibacillus sp. 6R]MBS7429120.1 MATE family efflux transporter [Virgibacillus sp. 19R1-5]MBU8566852.1 MATE family efflux transporter [Virgibacillus pantothenticus]MBU8600455.1 MATE family efflux transporter [Virgibacillus pantothenticus]MBU8635150.1 MATE family efflux transporter [Virgibacillus pantothenticus]